MITEVEATAERKALEEKLATLPTPEPQSWWDITKAFFHYSATILLARITTLIGLVVASAGAMNWAPLLSLNVDTGFNKNQVIWLGIITVIQGIGIEVARRRTLIPSSS